MIGIIPSFLTGLVAWNLHGNLKRQKVLGTSTPECQPEVIKGLTVALPVRNEAKNLKEFLPQLLAQKSRPERLLILDDQSQDETATTLEDHLKDCPWAEVIPGKKLKKGWSGKVWALEQLLGHTETASVLFMDADVMLDREDSLFQLWLAFEKSGSRGMLTVFPRPTSEGAASLAVYGIPLHLFHFLPFNYSRWKGQMAVAACGQVMIFQTDLLKKTGGFRRVRNSTHDGLKMARLFKEQKLSIDHVHGGEFVSSRVYEDFWSAMKGFTRNSYETTESIPVTVMICGTLYTVFVLPYLVLPFVILNPVWLLSWIALQYGQVKMVRKIGLKQSHLATLPLEGLSAISVHMAGALRSKLGWSINWRGRSV